MVHTIEREDMQEEGTQIHHPPLRFYLILIILAIVGIVLAAVLTLSYLQVKEQAVEGFTLLQRYTETNAEVAAGLVDRGLQLEDSRLNPQMEASLAEFLSIYEREGGNISAIDLEGLRPAIAPTIHGTIDFYIINESGVIVKSTVPEVLGLDFSNYSSFYQAITKIRLGSVFAADRVVPSVVSVNDSGVSGVLRKFAYLPTPDHRYILEMGLQSGSFQVVRDELSYQVMAENLMEANPLIEEIRIFDIYRNLIAVVSSSSEPLPPLPPGSTIDLVIGDHSPREVVNEVEGKLTKYLFIDLHKDQSVTDPSVILEVTYATAGLDDILEKIGIYYLAISALALILGGVLAFLAAGIFSGSITTIVEDIGVIANGDLTHPIHDMKTEEFSRLSDSITRMVARIVQYSEEIERSRAELRIAAEIQQEFLPRDVPAIPGLEIVAESTPALEIGGDFYDIIPLEGGMVALVIADVSGKGVPASLVMALSRTIVRTMSRFAWRVARIITDANLEFLVEAGGSSFVTLFYAVIDPQKMTLHYVSAGHNPQFLIHLDGSGLDLMPTGIAIGLSEDAVYSERQVPLAPGDLLVLYTDGASEAFNKGEEMFSEERLRDLAADRRNLPVRELLQVLHEEITAFAGEMPQSDDLTMMIVRVNGLHKQCRPGEEATREIN
ncbi:MAG: PP2C family protein-serine/threonine phosphatase [Methanomicrobiales archaeon]|nr:PP2C family protein-serine/threonine phosphatase [Methanomicrobiales archaeon]